MPQIRTSRNILIRAKTVKFSSFIYTEASEVELEYYNTFKEYVVDTQSTVGERQKIVYSPFKYSDYLDSITTSSFSTKVNYSTVSYNTQFNLSTHDLGIFSDTTDGSGINLISLRFADRIFQELDFIDGKVSDINKVIDTILIQSGSYTHTNILDYDKRRNMIKENSSTIVDQFSEITNASELDILESLYFSSNIEDVKTYFSALSTGNNDVLITESIRRVGLMLHELNLNANYSIVDGYAIPKQKETELNRNYYDLPYEDDLATKEQELSVNLTKTLLLQNPSENNLFEQSIPLLQNPATGLYYIHTDMRHEQIDKSFAFETDIDLIYEAKNLIYGKPDISFHPINAFFDSIILKKLDSSEFYPETNDIIVDMQPKYISDDDKSFIRSIFYIELDDYQDYLGYVPWIKPPSDTPYIPDDHYVSTKIYNPDRVIFKHKFEEIKFGGKNVVLDDGGMFIFFNSLEAKYAGYYREYDYIYEYINDLFEITNRNYSDSMKHHQTLYDKPESAHARKGGSQHAGHTLPTVAVLSNSTRVIPCEYIKTNTMKYVTEKYRFVQIVDNLNDSFGRLYEFDSVVHDIDKDSEQKKYSFNYELVIGSGRLPSCLTITNSIVSGNLGETEQFLNKYSYESWVDRQGLSVDLDYTDFNPDPTENISVELIGRTPTSGILDIVGDEYSIGDVITQKDNIGNIIASATVTKLIATYTKNLNLVGDEITLNSIHQYEIDEIRGEFIPSITIQVADDNGTPYFRFETREYAEDNIILESTVSTSGGLVKEVQLIFPINNNYTYDKDRFLYNTDLIPEIITIDGKDYSRSEWLDYMKSLGNYKFDPIENNKLIQEEIDLLEKNYAEGSITEEEYVEDLKLLQSLFGDVSLDMETVRLETINDFVIDCNNKVDEKTFYEYSGENLTTRGYPVYASCN